MQPLHLILVYSLLVFAMSLGGGTLPTRMQLSHTRLQIAMSLIGGLMLGVGLLHLLPHAFFATQSIDLTALCAVIGLLTMFSLIRIFHVHQHAPQEQTHTHCQQHGVPHAHADAPVPNHGQRPRLNWLGLMVGLSLHTLIDGVALASSVVVEATDTTTGLWGLGAFLAILLHKPLDAMSITTVMKAGHWSPRSMRVVNVIFALMCPLGALAFASGVHLIEMEQQTLLGMALAFSAGVFLCISLSDLLPEVQFHSHDRVILSCALLAGVVLSYLITFIEPAHVHGHAPVNHDQHSH